MARKALIANCKSEPRSALWDGEVRFDPLALRVVGDIPCALSVSLITGNGRVERVLIVAEDLRSRPAKMASDLWKQRRSPVDSADLLYLPREHQGNHHRTRR
jgi:hypothetical protein